MHDLLDQLRYRAEAGGNRTAFDDGTTRLGYAPLTSRVAGTAEELETIAATPPVVGLLGGNPIDWAVGQLAAWHAGLTVVPLPPFFAAAQLRHVIADAGIRHLLCTADAAEEARALGLPVTPIARRAGTLRPRRAGEARQIIYTSGSTGQPKGVLLGGRQLMWSARALAEASGARAEDSYLSVMPLALLLETLCALLVPILAGAPVRLEAGLAARFTEAEGLAAIIAARRPSCLVLVPHLLAAWLAQLEAAGARAPDSLRFVAVGGAAVPPALAARAWQRGIPVHEGYGLSECGSVVALNRPGERRAGTVGRPLPGLSLRLDGDEIVVAGPPVMEGYLHGPPAGGVIRTGDAGALDGDGYLQVRGRLDNVMVTAIGRKISPEWIEALITADPRVGHCVVTAAEAPHLGAVLVPSDQGEGWFADASADEVRALIADCCRDAPPYAVPRRHLVTSLGELRRRGLLTGNGRVRRRALAAELAAELAGALGAGAGR